MRFLPRALTLLAAFALWLPAVDARAQCAT